MPTNFHIAPPPKTVDGLFAVPMDIQSINGSITFNAATSVALADITIDYIVGPTAGRPFFDLRQNISSAILDGAAFPVAQLASHNFDTGTYTTLRVIDDVQAALSYHTLQLQYTLGTPQSQLGGSYIPVLDWLAGPSLKFVFGLSDLNAARYLEAWIPANLPFDQYSIDLDIIITNTLVPHTVITNATVTTVGTNHWQLSFPSRFSCVSPLLEIRATSTVESQTGNTVLPVSGKNITIEAFKLVGNAANLNTEINNIATFLAENEEAYGAYLHDNKFTALFTTINGGMEYEGGTTTASWALNHETFHSWFARGMKPAAQSDGWWDEAFTTFHDDGANDTLPFDYSDAPITLCSRNPWQRTTPGNSYDDGGRFWQGIAAILGVNTTNNLMRDMHNTYKGKSPVSTQMMEEFLICKSGNKDLVDAFHRFIYGFDDIGSPDLWMKDHTSHTGSDQWDGAFWDSRDLWSRNSDDDGTTHQSPEYGQDNWFYARVRNKSATNEAQHFVVTFNHKSWAGTQFLFPNDFLPAVAAKAEFTLGPGETRIVKAKWPRANIPAVGSHACVLASILCRGDHPVNNQHVWEHNNLAQKNTTVVDLLPNAFIIIPVVLTNYFDLLSDYIIEAWRDRRMEGYEVSLLHKDKMFFEGNDLKTIIHPDFSLKDHFKFDDRHALMDCGGHVDHYTQTIGMITDQRPDLLIRKLGNALEMPFSKEKVSGLSTNIPYQSQRVVGFKVKVPESAKPGTTFTTHLVQRHAKTKTITGGIAVTIHVADGRKTEK